jgi:hypothetical protein
MNRIVKEFFEGADIAKMHDDIRNRNAATVKGIAVEVRRSTGNKRVPYGPEAGRTYDRFDLFIGGKKVWWGEATSIDPLNIPGGSIEAFVLVALHEHGIKRKEVAL